MENGDSLSHCIQSGLFAASGHLGTHFFSSPSSFGGGGTCCRNPPHGGGTRVWVFGAPRPELLFLGLLPVDIKGKHCSGTSSYVLSYLRRKQVKVLLRSKGNTIVLFRNVWPCQGSLPDRRGTDEKRIKPQKRERGEREKNQRFVPRRERGSSVLLKKRLLLCVGYQL